MTRDEMVDFFERIDEAFEDLDAATLASTHAPDGTLETPTAGRVAGRAAIEKIYRTWFGAFPDLDVTREDLIVDGNRAVAIVRVTGTHYGEFFGLPSSGRPIEFRCARICTVEKHLIVHERRIYDFTGVLMQVGVLKPRPG